MPYFSKLKDEQLEEIFYFCKLKYYPAGDMLFIKGSKTENIFFLLKGNVKMMIPFKNRDVLVDGLYKNCIIGMYSAYNGAR